MPITIASFNIEKLGNTSSNSKLAQVDGFLGASNQAGADAIFLCEVNAWRREAMLVTLPDLYGNYNWAAYPGAGSNYYILGLSRIWSMDCISHAELQGIERNILMLQLLPQLSVCLAHFKSGGLPLTRFQVNSAIRFLSDPNMFAPRWAILGDINIDFHEGADKLTTEYPYLAVNDGCGPTRKNTSTLDWCIHSPAVTATSRSLLLGQPGVDYDMDAPDHRPIMFEFS